MSLTAARATMAARLVDTCTITRDPEQKADDTIDPVTLKLIPPASDKTTIYTGKCLLGPILDERMVVVGQREITRRRYRARLPHDAPVARAGDAFTLTAVAADGDTALVNVEMLVTDTVLRSLHVSRQVILQWDSGSERG